MLAIEYKIETGKIKEGESLAIPERTYVSVPNAIVNAGANFHLEDIEWYGEYEIGNTGIFDSAVNFAEGLMPLTYNKNIVKCVSFQQKKRITTLSGRGGAILTNDYKLWKYAKIMSCDGRDMSVPMSRTDKFELGAYNCYMSPLDAMKLIHEMNQIEHIPYKIGEYTDYKNLRELGLENG
jgi:dTDP-4-amino-4,6-dideoxygalactose transaminase